MTFLEYGSTRKVNADYLIVKNILQFSVAMIAWWLIGYAFARVDVQYKFVGQDEFGGQNWLYRVKNGETSYLGLIGIFVLFIINGGISEKAQYAVYPVFSFCVMVFIWPAVIAWIFSGWLQTEFTNSVKDRGFTISVYVFAGAFSMMGALLTGRRVGKYTHYLPAPAFKMENHVFYYIGALLTIIGIFTLNHSFDFNGYAMANSWIAGSTSSLVALKLLTMFSFDVESHFIAIYQGFIAGMVLISSSTNSQAWEAALFGMLAGLVFSLGVKFSKWLEYDDVLNIVPTFLYPGLIGGILPGFIDNNYGVFWGGKDGQTLAVHVVATVAVTGWGVFWGIVVFGTLKALGLLSITDQIQAVGLKNTILNQKGFVLKDIDNERLDQE